MRHIDTFYTYNDCVYILLTDGTSLTLNFNQFSGKAYFRYKIDTVSKIKHPGIYIGSDNAGIQYVAHNHYLYGKPVLVPLLEFTQGQELYPYPEYATNPPLIVIEKAMRGIQKEERYTPLLFNCQDYVNEALSDKRRSPAIENTFTGLAVLGLVFVGLAIAKS